MPKTNTNNRGGNNDWFNFIAIGDAIKLIQALAGTLRTRAGSGLGDRNLSSFRNEDDLKLYREALFRIQRHDIIITLI